MSVHTKTILNKIENLMQKEFRNETTGHDWVHADSVRKLALQLAKETKGMKDLFVIELAALLHDYNDRKFQNNATRKLPVASLLKSLGVEENIANHVAFITNNISYKAGLNKVKLHSIEGKLVQDADRLEALGAVGIARCFAYGGRKGRQIYNPDIPPLQLTSVAAYDNSNSTSMNHFYEKLLLLKDKMNTPSGKKYARKRHAFLKLFLTEFYREIQGIV